MTPTISTLATVLEATSKRQSVLANNLANANTPFYKRLDLKFKDELAKAISSGDINEIQNFKPTIVEDTTTPARPDGNNVSLQKEMAEINENALLFNFAAKAIAKKFDGLKKAIKGRG